MNFGTGAYTVGILSHAKFVSDRRRGGYRCPAQIKKFAENNGSFRRFITSQGRHYIGLQRSRRHFGEEQYTVGSLWHAKFGHNGRRDGRKMAKKFK